MPEEIVIPLRDVPGTRASTCARPIVSPSAKVTASRPCRPAAPRRPRRQASHSAAAIRQVVKSNAPVTTSKRRASPRISCRAAKPTTTIGTVPRMISRLVRDSGVASGRPERMPAKKPAARRAMSCRMAAHTAASVPHWITAE